ncbi:MAG TPA: hypothetical protein VIH55_04305 [Acidimicrobiia bacterium]
MFEGIEIKGGAGEFEVAVIAVVLDRIAEEERAAREGPRHDSSLTAWQQAGRHEEPNFPREIILPRRP